VDLSTGAFRQENDSPTISFHVRAARQVGNARLTGVFYGACPERSGEGLASPAPGNAPFRKGFSPFGPAPDVERPGYFTKPLWRLFPCGEFVLSGREIVDANGLRGKLWEEFRSL